MSKQHCPLTDTVAGVPRNLRRQQALHSQRTPTGQLERLIAFARSRHDEDTGDAASLGQALLPDVWLVRTNSYASDLHR